MKRNEAGFSAVEVILVFIIAALISIVGIILYRNHDKTANNSTVNSTSTVKPKVTAQVPTDPYVGWKTTCDDIVNACYRHPEDWIADQYDTGLENPAQTEYVSLNGSTVKDGGSGSAYIASIEDLSTPIADLKVVGTVTENHPGYAIYNNSYLVSNSIKVGNTQEIAYINYRFSGKTGEAGFVGTPSSKGYTSINTPGQAKAWFNTAEAKTVLKALKSFYYQ